MYYSFKASTNPLEVGSYPQVQQFDPNVDFSGFQEAVYKSGGVKNLEMIRLSLKLDRRAICTDVLSCSFCQFPLVNEKVKEIFSRFIIHAVALLPIAEVTSKNGLTPYYLIIPGKPAYEYLDLEKSVFARYNPVSLGDPSEYELFNSAKELEMALESNRKNNGTDKSGKLPLVIWKPVFKERVDLDLLPLDFAFIGYQSLFVSGRLRDELMASGITGARFDLV